MHPAKVPSQLSPPDKTWQLPEGLCRCKSAHRKKKKKSPKHENLAKENPYNDSDEKDLKLIKNPATASVVSATILPSTVAPR
jgi:hypothetical protein